jgi:hypothetical protein
MLPDYWQSVHITGNAAGRSLLHSCILAGATFSVAIHMDKSHGIIHPQPMRTNDAGLPPHREEGTPLTGS